MKMKCFSTLKNDVRKYQIESQVLLEINEKMGGNGIDRTCKESQLDDGSLWNFDDSNNARMVFR